MKRKKYQTFTWVAEEAETREELLNFAKRKAKAVVVRKDADKAVKKTFNDEVDNREKRQRNAGRAFFTGIGSMILGTLTGGLFLLTVAVIGAIGSACTMFNGLKKGDLKDLTQVKEYDEYFLLLEKEVDVDLDTVIYNNEKIL